jgi:hypothetical protein
VADACRKPITCYCVFVVSVFAPSAFAGAVLASFALSVLVLLALVSTVAFLVALWAFAVWLVEAFFTCDFVAALVGAFVALAPSSVALFCTAVLAFRLA